MRLIRPSALSPVQRRRSLVLALSMLAVGILAGQIMVVAPPQPMATGMTAGAAALGLGVGSAWLLRTLRPDRTRELTTALGDLLTPIFDDTYTLVLAPRLPVRDAVRLDGILVGPAGVRVVTARDWEGRFRVRGRVWHYDAGGRRGWIACRTNPSFDAVALAEGVARWAAAHDLGELSIRPTVAFPLRRSTIVLEEPADEILSSDNAPYWANAIGRVRRLDAALGARAVAAILDAAESDGRPASTLAASRQS